MCGFWRIGISWDVRVEYSLCYQEPRAEVATMMAQNVLSAGIEALHARLRVWFHHRPRRVLDTQKERCYDMIRE